MRQARRCPAARTGRGCGGAHGWPLAPCCPPTQAGPPLAQGLGGLEARLGQYGPIPVAFLWSLSPSARVGGRGGRERGVSGGQHLLPIPRSWLSHGVQGRRRWRQPATRRLLPNRAPQPKSPQDTAGPLSPPAAGEQDSIPSVPMSREGPQCASSSRIPVLRLPVAEAPPPAPGHTPGHRTQPAEPQGTVSVDIVPGQGARGPPPPPRPSHRKTLGAGGPWRSGQGALDSGRVGGSGSQGKRAPPWGLGQAGATGDHNNYKIKPFPLCGKNK